MTYALSTIIRRRCWPSQTQASFTQIRSLRGRTDYDSPRNATGPPSSSSLVEKAFQERLYEQLSDAATPLWRLPYARQLELKFEKNRNVLLKLTGILRKKAAPKSTLCPLSPVVASPVTEGYRNKDEFHVRLDASGRPVCGLLVGRARDASLVCVAPDRLVNTRRHHAEVAHLFRDYVARSDWPVCEHFDRGGHWRQLTVRSNSAGQLMLAAVVHPQQLGADAIDAEMRRFADHMVRAAGHLDIHSFLYQACRHTRCSSDQAPYVLLHGEPYLYETIDGFRFRLSPESFLQVNTAAATLLYDVVRRMLKPTRMTTILDMCCGIGTQGIVTSGEARGVVGIEQSARAVDDARFNAALNNVHQAEFHAGGVEHLLGRVLQRLELSADIAAIVNPSRGGLHGKVIQQLRANERIQRLVYASCQPEGPALQNFVDLLRPADNKRLTGRPFRLVAAVPVDLFPHTPHCELVLHFERT